MAAIGLYNGGRSGGHRRRAHTDTPSVLFGVTHGVSTKNPFPDDPLAV
jgi:hypothetical protein